MSRAPLLVFRLRRDPVLSIRHTVDELYKNLHAQSIVHGDPQRRHIRNAFPPADAYADIRELEAALGSRPYRPGTLDYRLIDFEGAAPGDWENYELEWRRVQEL